MGCVVRQVLSGGGALRFPVVRRLQSRRHGRNLPGDLPRRRAKPGIISRQEFFSNVVIARGREQGAGFSRKKSRRETGRQRCPVLARWRARERPNRSAIEMTRAGYRGDKCRNFSSHSAKPRSAGGSLPGNHRAALLWRAELRRNRGRVALESENGQLALKQVSRSPVRHREKNLSIRTFIYRLT